MERLHRLEQVYVENPVYFLTFCSAGRKAIVANEQVRDVLVQFGCEAMKRNIFAGRYILMPNRIHLFVKLPSPSDNLSRWIKSLKNSLSKVLRSLFFDHVLRSTESYSDKWLYMVENSIRSGLVSDWAKWRFQGEIQPLRLDQSLRRSQTAAT